MADEQDDPPIGTAQNAADVARKAELEEANKAEVVIQVADKRLTADELALLVHAKTSVCCPNCGHQLYIMAGA
jgi:F420-0:gamma-glutamyl ligase